MAGVEIAGVFEESSTKGIRRDMQSLRGIRFQVGPAPEWVVRRKVMGFDRPPGEPVSVLLVDRQIHPGRKTRYNRIVRRLETAQAVQELAKIELSFDPEIDRLLVHGVSIFRAGTLTNHAVEADFELFQREESLESGVLRGGVTALLLLRDVRVGDIVDMEFSFVSDAGLFGEHFWHTETVESLRPVARQWVSWMEVEGQTSHVRLPSVPVTETREESAHGIARTWHFEKLPVLRLEANVPDTLFQIAELNITTLSSWADLKALYLEPWSAEPADRTELDRELERLRERYTMDPDGAVRETVELVRDQVRYMGYSPGVLAVVPTDLGQVWARRFGDCKEKSRLLVWLLRELGLEADPVLVHAEWGARLDRFPPSPGAFNHVVARFRHDGREYWIDATNVAQRGTLADWTFLNFHHGLPLVAGDEELVAIPGPPAGHSGLEVEEIVRVDSRTAGAEISITHTYRGLEANGVRGFLDTRGYLPMGDFLTQQVNHTRKGSVAISDLEVEDDPEANRMILRRKFRCEEVLMYSNQRRQDILALMPYSIPPRVVPAPQAGRRHPLELEHPVNVKHVIRVNSDQPRGIRIPSTTVNNEFLGFSFATSTSRTESVHSFTFATKAAEVPLGKMRVYTSALEQIGAAINWSISFTPRKRGEPPRKTGSPPGRW